MDPLSNLALGALIGVAVAMAFWLLASLLDGLRHQPALRRVQRAGGPAGPAAPRGAPGP